MIISAAIFGAYLKCPSKYWFLFSGKEGDANIYSDFVRNKSKAYLAAGLERLRVKIQPSECIAMPSAPVPETGSAYSFDAESFSRFSTLAREDGIEPVDYTPANRGRPDGPAISLMRVNWVPIREPSC